VVALARGVEDDLTSAAGEERAVESF
ncbi:uncharacterized protein METZ01_LOCUS42306, partial [marine metagenome]